MVALTALALAGPGVGEPAEAGLDRAEGSQRAGSERLVVAITVDGLTSDAVAALGRAEAPAFHRMLRHGAGTLNARTAVEHTRTMPNHSGVFTGRRVLGTFGHQVTFNDDSVATDLHTVAGRYVPSMFDVVHDRGGLVRFFASKRKFAFFDRSWDSRHGAVDTRGVDDGRDKIDRYVVDTDPKALVDRVVRTLRKHPATLTYLHVRWPDSAGHRYGWESEEYLAAVAKSSAQVGRILRTVARRDRLRSRATVVLTSDHGGEGREHSDSGLPINYTVPFLVWGRGVARGADLYDLNPERVDPGTTQPDYFAGEPPVRNLDLASLVTTHLGRGQVPGGTAPHTTALAVS